VPIAREGSVDQDLIEDSIQRIKSYLNQQGYWKADASADRQEGQGTLTVAFTVRRGPHYRIAGGVEVVGNQTVPIEQLRPALAKLQANDVFIESNLGAAVSAIAGTYQRLGFARARRRRDVRRQRRRAGGAASRGGEIDARGAVLPAAGRGGLRRGDAGVPEPWLRRRQRPRRAGAVAGRHPRQPHVSDPRGAADDRRPHP